MRIETRLAKLEKVSAERRPACPCPWVKLVHPDDVGRVPGACPACGKEWRRIIIDEFDGVSTRAPSQAA